MVGSQRSLDIRTLLRWGLPARVVKLTGAWVAALLVGWPWVAPADELAAPSFFMHPGVLVDPVQGRIFVAAAAGGLDAIALSSGEVLWQSSVIDFPLWVSADGGLVFGVQQWEAGQLRVALLDTVGGPRLRWSATVPLPPDVDARLQFVGRSRFRIRACPDEQGILVRWQFARPLKDPATFERGLSVLEGNVFYRWSGEIQVTPETAGCTQPGRRPNDQGPLRGSRTENGSIIRSFSSDGRHYVASRRISAERGIGGAFLWGVYERATGRRIGQLEQS